jgi:hypothetical protein
MVSGNISMPHPVLGIGSDFTEGDFTFSCKIVIDKSTRTYIFDDIICKISNEYVQDLYQNGFLDLVVKVSCIPTYKTWNFINPTEIKIPENELDLLVEVESFLIASRANEDYYDKTFNEDFSDVKFALEKGDIVGLTGSKKIPIPKENEKTSLGSIFRFLKIPEGAKIKELNFGFDDDQIVINYPSNNDEYDPINLLFDKIQGMPYTAVNLYIIPALTEAFSIMDGDDRDDLSDKKWFSVLDALLPPSQRSVEAYINAQKVIKGDLPLNLAFNEIIKAKKS